MIVPISAKIAAERHPEQYKQILAKLRSGKSKNKNATAKQLEWGYSWAELIETETFDQILAGAGRPKPIPSAAEQIKTRTDRSSVMLFARIGNWTGYGKEPVFNGEDEAERKKKKNKLPEEIQQIIKQSTKDEAADRKRRDAMTPAEKDAEVSEAIAELAKSEGFFMGSIPVMAVPSGTSMGVCGPACGCDADDSPVSSIMKRFQ